MFDKLFSSFTIIDIGIIGTAMVSAVLFIICLKFANDIRNGIAEWKRTSDSKYLSSGTNYLIVFYNIFLTIISIFPLLGMFGTVMGLLNVDFSIGTMDDVKTNFFTALTSTAWGIFFSVIFKILNSFFAYHIETQIEESKKIEEMIGLKRSKKSR